MHSRTGTFQASPIYAPRLVRHVADLRAVLLGGRVPEGYNSQADLRYETVYYVRGFVEMMQNAHFLQLPESEAMQTVEEGEIAFLQGLEVGTLIDSTRKQYNQGFLEESPEQEEEMVNTFLRLLEERAEAILEHGLRKINESDRMYDPGYATETTPCNIAVALCKAVTEIKDALIESSALDSIPVRKSRLRAAKWKDKVRSVRIKTCNARALLTEHQVLHKTNALCEEIQRSFDMSSSDALTLSGTLTQVMETAASRIRDIDTDLRSLGFSVDFHTS